MHPGSDGPIAEALSEQRGQPGLQGRLENDRAAAGPWTHIQMQASQEMRGEKLSGVIDNMASVK